MDNQIGGIEEFRPRDHQKMHKRVVGQAPPQHDVPIGGVLMAPFKNPFGIYFENLLGGMNYIGNSMDLLFSHLHIKRFDNM